MVCQHGSRPLQRIAVFLDLKKTFDTVNHDILLRKLQMYGFGKNVLTLLRCYRHIEHMSVTKYDFRSETNNLWHSPGKYTWPSSVHHLYK